MLAPPEYNKKENAKRLREGLENHILFISRRGRAKYPELDSIETFKELLSDPEVVRFPAVLEFDTENTDNHRCVAVDRLSEAPEENYRISIHPYFKGRERDVVALALYVIVKINYGKIAKEKEAELFASNMLGIGTEEYHEWIERLSVEINQH